MADVDVLFERIKALEEALRTFAFTEDELFETQKFDDEERIIMRPDDGNDSVTNGWGKVVHFSDVRRAHEILDGIPS